MKHFIISLLWICIASMTSYLLLSVQVQWEPTLILAFFILVISIITGIITLIKIEKAAHIPLILGILALFSLCALLEIKYFFIITFVYYVGIIIYFISVGSRRKTW